MVVPDDVRAEIAAHASDEAPNESCGLLAVRGGVAERYIRGINDAASPYRFELRLQNPEDWFLEDHGYELAVVHSHPPEAPTGSQPSRTDVENIGLWEGRPYLVYALATGELGAWTIENGEVSPLR